MSKRCRQTCKKIFLIFLLLVSIERFCRLQTDGFRIEKTKGISLSTHKLPLPPEILEMLHEPYTFLGSGVQSYAFLSADRSKVLKLFKHYHIGLPTHSLKTILLPQCLRALRTHTLSQRAKRMAAIYNSHQIAFDSLRKETGLLHLQLEPCLGPLVTIYDKIGIRHEVDISQTPFVLQKFASPLFSSLSQELKEKQLPRVKEKIDSLLALMKNRHQKGIANNDPILHRNFGFIGTEAVEIDTGSFVKHPVQATTFSLRKELYLSTCELHEWLEKHSKELADYLMQKITNEIL